MLKLRTIVEAGDPEKIAGGFEFTEGPIWHPDGFLLFSDIPAGRIYRLDPGADVAVWREPSGNSNGLTLDGSGRLIACEHGNRRVSRTEADGSIITLADRYNGRRLNRPNDVVSRSDGLIYFTDPPYGKNPGERMEPEEIEQPHNGLYRIDLDGTITLLAADFERPNGLAFSPDEQILYVDDSARRHVRAFDVASDGTLHNSRIIADLDHPQPGSPDGMKIDMQGHLYVTGATGVWVFEPDGTHLGVIVTPERPANCAWGDADRQTLYITARTSIYRIRTLIPGSPAQPGR
ncbi:MAG TPA: SMP-30/gluconolactonase/LRE family protein [Roseiflexaceae bacterium]|nr:SMP-30/gluconolactonase/LRE family protein [Roseiflexaceae bacterium]HMP42177.1 SMP-30/gluconolactonase/LRE family protein [Roseiflexaceae bacterium]